MMILTIAAGVVLGLLVFGLAMGALANHLER
jgi:hypothetical protein